MNYEEKYKEALERAKRLHSEPTGETERIVCEQIFPELAESEDERIRKWCISHFKAAVLVTKNNAEYQEYLNNKVIPWLEKQKEFVSADFDDVWETADCDELTAPLEKYSKDAIKEMCHAWYDKGIELERRNWLEKQGLQKLANPAKTCKNDEEIWSEEDERLCQCLIKDQKKALNEVRNDKYGHSEIISDLKEMYNERIAWLKSLKEKLVVK